MVIGLREKEEKDLHNLRVKLEQFEEKEWAEGRGTLSNVST